MTSVLYSVCTLSGQLWGQPVQLCEWQHQQGAGGVWWGDLPRDHERWPGELRSNEKQWDLLQVTMRQRLTRSCLTSVDARCRAVSSTISPTLTGFRSHLDTSWSHESIITKYSGDPELEDPGLCDALPGGEAGLRWGVPQALLNTLRRKEDAEASYLLYSSMSIFHFTAQILSGVPLYCSNLPWRCLLLTTHTFLL